MDSNYENNEKQPYEDFSEEKDSSFNSGFENEFFAAEKINIMGIGQKKTQSDKKGVRIFCFVLAVVLVLGIFSTAGYFIGKNQTVKAGLINKPLGAEEGNAAAVYNSVSLSIVSVYAYSENGEEAIASGIIYSSDGYVITSDSTFIVAPEAKLFVRLNDGTEYPAVFVGGDTISNIAVIKINNAKNLVPATLGNSDQTVVGEWVYAIGFENGYGEKSTLNGGTVSACDYRVSDPYTKYASKSITIDFTVSPSAYGGALVNGYGHVIGKLDRQFLNNSNYVVPSVLIKKIADEIIENGVVSDRARLGITYLLVNKAYATLEELPTTGMLVASVDEASDLKNFIKAGDIITEINGKRINDKSDVLDVIETAKPNDIVRVKVVTEIGSEAEYSVKLLSLKSESYYNSAENLGGNGLEEAPGNIEDF